MKDNIHNGRGTLSKKDLENQPETPKVFTEKHDNDDEEVLQNNDSPGDGSKGDDTYRGLKNDGNDLSAAENEDIP